MTEDAEQTFEYVFLNEKIKKLPQEMKELPFQLQIRYTKLDGMRCLRVESKTQPVTRDRKVVAKDIKFDVLAANVAQQSAKLAKKGEYAQAMAYKNAWTDYMGSSAQNNEQKQVFNAYQQQMNVYDNVLVTESVRKRAFLFFLLEGRQLTLPSLFLFFPSQCRPSWKPWTRRQAVWTRNKSRLSPRPAVTTLPILP